MCVHVSAFKFPLAVLPVQWNVGLSPGRSAAGGEAV